MYVLNGWSHTSEISSIDLKNCRYFAVFRFTHWIMFLTFLSNIQKVISLLANCKQTLLKPKEIWVQNLSFLAKITSDLEVLTPSNYIWTSCGKIIKDSPFFFSAVSGLVRCSSCIFSSNVHLQWNGDFIVEFTCVWSNSL